VTLKAPPIVTRAQIDLLLPGIDAIGAMERAFAAYSTHRAEVPPVGEILFAESDGEAHIKSGYIKGDDVFVVKVATGFYRNPGLNLPTSSGAVLIFDARNGSTRAVLLDEGLLTDYRTAAAGAMAAKYLAPTRIERIGIVGGGTQARLQAELLKAITPCRSIVVWARRKESAAMCAQSWARSGFAVSVADTAAQVAQSANLIVTATASKEPLLQVRDIRPGTHITAVGADSPHKQELAAEIASSADVLAVDSLSQARERGELHHALPAYPELAAKAVELGAIVSGTVPGRTGEDQITLADLTGVAVQDIEIAKAVLAALGELPA
jgi:ornithine cyclodeaminase